MKTVDQTPEKIASLLAHICCNEADDFAVTHLVNICIEMGASYLRYLESTGRRIRESTDAKEIPQIACEGIAVLFSRDNKGSFTSLSRIFTPLMTRNASAEEWLLLLRRVITRRMQQHLTRIYQERDPETARLWRNLRLSSLDLPDVVLRRDMMGLTIEYYPSELAANLPFTHPPTTLLEAAIHVFQPRMTIDEMLRIFLQYLFSLLNKPIIITMHELVRLISDYRQHMEFENIKAEEPTTSDNRLMQICINAAQNSMNLIQKTLIQQYIEKKKITCQEALAFFSAVKETLLARLQADNPEEFTFTNALRVHWPELDENRYRNEIRPLLDYIVKLYRKEMKRRLEGIL